MSYVYSFKSTLLACLLLYGFSASADVVILKNGDRISGIIQSKTGDQLLINNDYLGEVNLPWSQVTSLVTEQAVRVELNGERLISGTVIPSTQGSLKLAADELFETRAIPLAQVSAINPPVHDSKVKVSGTVNIGAEAFDGNTDSKTFHGDAEVIARSKNNRVTIGGALDWATDNGVESTNNGIAYGKYDHFITDKWFAYANTSFETDRFQDLDLRTTLGTGVGYQFIETDRTQLSLEGGPSFVSEDYKNGEDISFVAGRWALRFDHWLYQDMLQFFHYHEGLLSFDNIDDIYIRTRTGLRIPLYRGFAVTTEIDFDYDNVPAAGKGKTDTAYLLNLGYGF